HSLTTSLLSFTPLRAHSIFTLSLHDALPICLSAAPGTVFPTQTGLYRLEDEATGASAPPYTCCSVTVTDGGATVTLAVPIEIGADRKSTRLNSSHQIISYAVFCLK